MNFEKYLRKLAKSISAQNLFIAARDMSSIKLFKNSINFSRLQQEYLNYLYSYYNIYQDVYSNKVSAKVLDEDIYTDAYLYYRSKYKKNSLDKSTNKKRKLSAVFAKDNTKIKFPENKEVK
jgi:hypothetical protein